MIACQRFRRERTIDKILFYIYIYSIFNLNLIVIHSIQKKKKQISENYEYFKLRW